MSLGLIQPGASVVLRHPKTGAVIEPLYVRKNGTAVWPVLGAGPDDPDDPAFTGEGGEGDDDDSDDDGEDDDEDEPPARRKKAKSRRQDDDDDDEDDDDEDEDDDPRVKKASHQAKRYRLKLREQERVNADLKARIKAIEARDLPDDEVVARDLSEMRETVESLTEVNRIQSAQLAFFKTTVPNVTWIDANDVFALAEREGLFDDVIDESGNVDTRELRRGLRDLAKRKPHLVKKTKVEPTRSRKTTDDDDDEGDEEPRSRRSAAPMNGGRKGSRASGPSRTDLAKKFPVLNRV